MVFCNKYTNTSYNVIHARHEVITIMAHCVFILETQQNQSCTRPFCSETQSSKYKELNLKINIHGISGQYRTAKSALNNY